MCDFDSANMNVIIEFPINSVSRIITKEFCTRNTGKVCCNLTFDGPLQFLTTRFWISIAQLLIRNKAFPCNLLLSGRTFSIRIFFNFRELLLNVNNSFILHLMLPHFNLFIVTLKQPLTFNATIPLLVIVTLLISTRFLTCSKNLQLSLLFFNINLPLWINESLT